jgi:peroxiredoxin Q/BCP
LGIRDDYPAFQQHGAVVLGCSPDTPDALARFRAKYDLPFTFLSDVDHQIAEAYGAWVLRERDGRSFMGIARSTFIIGPDGTVAHVFRNVKPAGHAQELLAALA